MLAVAAAAAVVAWVAVARRRAAGKLRVAVLPFTPDRDDAGAAAQAVASASRKASRPSSCDDGRFGIVASSAARAAYSRDRRPRDISAAIEGDILVEARITTDADRVRVETRVTDGRREEKLWVRGFAGTVTTADELEREIASAVADAVGALPRRSQ